MFGGILLLATHGSVQSQPVTASQSDAGASAAKNIARIALSRPAWRELTLDQQKALYPLTSVWDGLSEQHKRKWLALSRNHAKLSPAEQASYNNAVGRLSAVGHHALRSVVSGGCDPVDGMPYIATEWIEGTRLKAYTEQGPLAPHDAAAMLGQALEVCQILS
ncbi:MAG: DUF3106 domain-containing protein, partial [Zymomonas sp.]